MSRAVDLLVVGAGPAGMAAAIGARNAGLAVLVVDEQPAPGGQIWRAIEANAGTSRMRLLGASYQQGLAAVRAFRACGATYEPGAKVWHVEPGLRVFMSKDGAASDVQARAVLFATGAQERPVPFPGWTLPGVMTVGAAQILLKSAGQIPAEPVWIAGNGPLPLLFATQFLRAGGRVAGFLETGDHGRMRAALPTLSRAVMHAPRDLLAGLGWLATLRRSADRFVRRVTEIEAIGTDALRAIRYRSADGTAASVPARLLLVHEGLVPTIHPTLALNCAHEWSAAQECFAPRLDAWGETSHRGVFVAGDGAGIAGATAAGLRGEIAALGVAAKLGTISEEDARGRAAPLRARLARALAARPLLDTLYRPRRSVLVPADDTIACRCENISVSEIRAQAHGGRPGANQVKAFTRAGMGPCQGRQCAYTVAHVLAEAEHRPVPDIGLYRVRPPIRPVTLGELAALDRAEASA